MERLEKMAIAPSVAEQLALAPSFADRLEKLRERWSARGAALEKREVYEAESLEDAVDKELIRMSTAPLSELVFHPNDDMSLVVVVGFGGLRDYQNDGVFSAMAWVTMNKSLDTGSMFAEHGLVYDIFTQHDGGVVLFALSGAELKGFALRLSDVEERALRERRAKWDRTIVEFSTLREALEAEISRLEKDDDEIYPIIGVGGVRDAREPWGQDVLVHTSLGGSWKWSDVARMAETFCGAEGLMFGSQMTRYTEPCQGHFRFHVRPNRTTVHDYDIDERQRAGEAREAEDPHDARTEAIRGT